MTTISYSSPTFNLGKISKAVKGCGLNMEVHGTEFKKVTFADGSTASVEYSNYTVSGVQEVVEGYQIVASVEHIDGMNIINKFVNEIELPVEFRTRQPFCDHCNTRRIKVKSIILLNIETGEFKHVGRGCITKFFTTDIDRILAQLSIVRDLNSEESEYSEFGSSDRNYQVREVLEVAFASIRLYGFRKSNEEHSTKDSMYSAFGSGSAYYETNRDDIDNADNALVWLLNQNTSSEFFANLNNFVKMNYISPRHFGYIAGFAASYLRDTAKKAEEKSLIVSEYVGTIGKREVFSNMTLLKKITIESFYGYSYLHIFLDATGHKVSWFASNDSEIEEGYIVDFKATVKKHEEFRDVKQTVITRVTFI